MKKIAITLAAMSLTLVTACGGGGVTEGEVIGKEHIPAKTWTEQVKDYDSKCTTTRKNGKSTRTCKKVFDGYDEVERGEDECYQLELRKDDETGTVCVDASEYEGIEVGDYHK